MNAITTETTVPSKTLDDLMQTEVQALATARAALGQLVHALQEGIEALKADHMPGIRLAVDQAGAFWQQLHDQIKAHPQLFVKPRTAVAHGIKFGLAKGKGGLEIADPDKTVLLIRKHYPEQADVLIASKEAPVKDALAQLSGADLKLLGVKLLDSDDQVVIRPADGDVDKLVKSLMRAVLEADEEARS